MATMALLVAAVGWSGIQRGDTERVSQPEPGKVPAATMLSAPDDIKPHALEVTSLDERLGPRLGVVAAAAVVQKAGPRVSPHLAQVSDSLKGEDRSASIVDVNFKAANRR